MKILTRIFLIMILLTSLSCSDTSKLEERMTKLEALSDQDKLEGLSQLGGLDVDLDSNDKMDTAYGGTNVDSSGWTGFIYVTAGVYAQLTGAGLYSINGLTETNGGLLYGTGDNAYAWLAAGTSGYLLKGNGAAAPSWTNTLSGLTFGGFSNSMAVVSDGSGNLISSATVSVTEVNYLNGVTGALYFAGGTDVADDDVADNITLTNITQITTKPITALSATNWRIFYSADGAVPVELELGAANTFLGSDGAAVAPSFQTLVDADIPDTITIDLAAVATDVAAEGVEAGDIDLDGNFTNLTGDWATTGYVSGQANTLTDTSGVITLTVNAVNYGSDTGKANIPTGACDAAADVGNWVVLISSVADAYQMTSDDESNQFIITANAAALTANNELDVDGTMVSVMCIAAELWKVTGYMGAIPTDGGAP